jgi:hypothetical protein
MRIFLRILPAELSKDFPADITCAELSHDFRAGTTCGIFPYINPQETMEYSFYTLNGQENPQIFLQIIFSKKFRRKIAYF